MDAVTGWRNRSTRPAVTTRPSNRTSNGVPLLKRSLAAEVSWASLDALPADDGCWSGFIKENLLNVEVGPAGAEGFGKNPARFVVALLLAAVVDLGQLSVQASGVIWWIVSAA